MGVLNRGSHGSSEEDGTIGLTLLHSAGYSAADGDYEKTLHEIRHTVRMEQGERLFSFRLEAGSEELLEQLDQKAQTYNEQPYAFAMNASGNGVKPLPAMLMDPEESLVSACKKSEKQGGYIIRLYESAGRENKGVLSFPWLEAAYEVSLQPFEIRTLHLDEKSGVIKETEMIWEGQ